MNKASTKVAMGYAHSKLILIGEHAVVYGNHAIAIPFPLKVSSRIDESGGPITIESSIYTGCADNLPVKMKGIGECIKETLNYLNKPIKNLRIQIDSQIPIGRGLGSSAAIAVAVVRGLFAFYGQKLPKKELFSLVHIAEAYAHGKPSGIDMEAVSSKSPIWFQKGKDTVSLKPKGPLYIVVADTGHVGDTYTAVENVRKMYLSQGLMVKKSLMEIEKIANEAKEAFLKGDIYQLGELLNRNQKELMYLGVSNDELNRLIKTAINAGALGAKLTGGGLGGCIMAIAENIEKAKFIAEELVKKDALKSWYFNIEDNILYLPGN